MSRQELERKSYSISTLVLQTEGRNRRTNVQISSWKRANFVISAAIDLSSTAFERSPSATLELAQFCCSYVNNHMLSLVLAFVIALHWIVCIVFQVLNDPFHFWLVCQSPRLYLHVGNVVIMIAPFHCYLQSVKIRI